MDPFRQEISQFIRDVRLNPNDPFAHYNLAHHYAILYKKTRDRKKYNYCVDHYKAALLLRPVFFEALTNLGMCMVDNYIESGKQLSYHYLNESIGYLEKARVIGKEGEEGILPWTYSGQAYHLLGVNTKEEKHILLSIESYAEAEKRGCNSRNVWVAYAEALVELSLMTLDLSKFDEAAEKYQNAIEAGYDVAEIYSRRIIDAYRMMGRGTNSAGLVSHCIDKLVDLTSEALDMNIKFNELQKQSIVSISKGVIQSGHFLQAQYAKSVPELLIPFFVFAHNQKELLAD